MKTMTCRQMGGMCDHIMKAETAEEMIKNGMIHLELEHPEMFAQINSMPKDHPEIVKWGEKFQSDWDNIPEDVQ